MRPINLRISPKESEVLDRKLGLRGEVVYDSTNGTLRVFDGEVVGGYQLARSAGSTNTFRTIAVAGQSSVVADSTTDTLTLVAGSNVILTTNATTDTITIAATMENYSLPVATTSTLGGVKVDNDTIIINNGVIRANISNVEGFSFNVAADDSTQVEIKSGELVKFIGAGGITTSSNVEGYITITQTAASTAFSSLTDATTADALTIDKVYLPAITRLVVSNTGTTAFLFDQYAGNNPTIFVISGTTIAFEITSTGHPFEIQDSTGTAYNTGLIHVSTTGVVSTGSAAQGKTGGTLYWKVPAGISASPPNFRYQCQDHPGMVGAITIKNIAAI